MSQFGKSEEQIQWKYSNAQNKILGYQRGVAEGLNVSGIAVSKNNYTALTVQSTNIYYLAQTGIWLHVAVLFGHL